MLSSSDIQGLVTLGVLMLWLVIRTIDHQMKQKERS